MASTLDERRTEQREPRLEKGMVALIGPLGTCVAIVTRVHAEEIIKERTDEFGICTWSFEQL